MKKQKKNLLSLAVIGVLMMTVFAGCGGDSGATSSAEPEAQEVLATYEYNAEATDEQNEAAENAVSYIKTTYMSKAALLNQLVEFDGFSAEAAQYAVDHITTDWKKVALASGNNYLANSNFSKQGLFDQLTSTCGEQFEAEEAQYAVDNVDVDWKKEALGAAKSYLDTGSFSEQGLLDQLTSSYADEFTQEEAQYALQNIKADWNAEALEAAESYYDTGMTDKTEIFNQITSQYADKFTMEQAQYAIDHLDPTKLDAQ